MIPDQKARTQALDPRQSFIIQAPAGSGKTELLTQRLLALLAHVKRPEAIVAITFTRKAAAEMRQRLLGALEKGKGPCPETAHEQQTWQLAQAVLQQDLVENWQLLSQPSRLRILTIDAFAASLARQQPILSHLGGACQPAQDPRLLYRQAVSYLWQGLLDDAPWSSALGHLLLLMQNRYAALENLFISLLAKREQWLPYLTEVDHTTLRTQLENSLAVLIEEHEAQLTRAFSQEQLQLLQQTLAYLEQFITANTDLGLWQSIANLLLTKEGKWRKSFTARQGFPSPSNLKSKEDKDALKHQKAQLQAIIAEVSADEELRELLFSSLLLPNAEYSDTEWRLLESLIAVLPTLAALLQVVFTEQRQVDFTEISIAALTALGHEFAPTDLALKLDHQIEHLLVDEFQDTSFLQFRLLEKIVHEWQHDAGRTLFLVGDPMQSIYGFRQAEVSLFLQARLHGLGPVKLTYLALSANFRSHAPIIDWCNKVFAASFPQTMQIERAHVPYHAAHATKAPIDAHVAKHAVNDDIQEAELVAKLCQAYTSKHPKHSVAILVRSRTHLAHIIPALQADNIAFQATEVEALSEQQLSYDLLSLTECYLQLENREAWLSLLRAPYCGIALADLLKIADGPFIIYDALLNKDIWENLSADAKQRLNFVIPIVQEALANRQRSNLRDSIYQLWQQLRGPACYPLAEHENLSKQFFDFLEQHEVAGQLPDLYSFRDKLLNLYLDHPEPAQVQIMTIHKSKGLEFDCVILPGLTRRGQSDSKELLYWQEFMSHDETSHLLLAPLLTQKGEQQTYEFIRLEQQKKREAEVLRLLYVAATRAKHELHLLAQLEVDEDENYKDPSKSSLLAKIWNAAHGQWQDANVSLTAHNETSSSTIPINLPCPQSSTRAPAQYSERVYSLSRTNSASENDIARPLTLTRLTLDNYPELVEKPEKNKIARNNYQGLLREQQQAALIGTFTHRILKQIHEQGLAAWSATRISQAQDTWRQALLRLGIVPHAVDAGLNSVILAINNLLTDERGQWLLQQRAESFAELPIIERVADGFKTHILDLFFIEDNCAWIVDYKIIQITELNTADFIKQEREQYLPQLKRYARLIAELYPEVDNINMALYFPIQQLWHTEPYHDIVTTVE